MKYIIAICIVFIILGCFKEETEYNLKSSNLRFSFPPNVKESSDSLSSDAIKKMGEELELKTFYDGDRLYYVNKYGACFTPAQVPTIYSHKAEYFKELKDIWEKKG